MMKKIIMRLLQIRFYKKFLGSLFFGDAVDKGIHEEPKNKLTRKFEAKGRICNSLVMISCFCLAFNDGYPVGISTP